MACRPHFYDCCPQFLSGTFAEGGWEGPSQQACACCRPTLLPLCSLCCLCPHGHLPPGPCRLWKRAAVLP